SIAVYYEVTPHLVFRCAFISDNGSNGKVPAVELAERAVTVCNYTLLCSNPGVQAYGATSKKCGTCGSWTAFAQKTVAATQ
ncbi:hypothetical protein Tco_1333339, partial [Tanacetum coccineum]